MAQIVVLDKPMPAQFSVPSGALALKLATLIKVMLNAI
jgi:hypothetical protein